MKKEYKVRSYDVWGNSKEGYEVNNVYPTSFTIELDDDATTIDIIKALKDVGFLNKSCKNSKFDIHWSDENYGFVERIRDGFPICELINEEG